MLKFGGLSVDCGESVYDGEFLIDCFDLFVIFFLCKCGGVFIMISFGEEVFGTKRFRGFGEFAYSRIIFKFVIVIFCVDGVVYSVCFIDGVFLNKLLGK